MQKELYFQPAKGESKKNKIKIRLWRIVDALFYQTSLVDFTRWRVFLLRLFGAKIGRGVYLSPKSKILIPWNVEIGNYSSLDDYAFLRSTGKIIIGDYVSIAMYAHIVPGGHNIRSRQFENNATFVKIGNGCFIGADSFVGRSVTIGQFSVVGARSVVLKDVPENSVAIGYPAKVQGERIPREEYEKYRYGYVKQG